MNMNDIYIQTFKKKRIDGNTLIITNRKLEMFVLNKSAKVIYEMFNGKTNLKNLLKNFCDCYEGDRQKIENDALVLIKQLHENLLINRI